MATTGDKISYTWEGKEALIKKVANLGDLNKQRALLFSIYSQSATPVVKPYKDAYPELNDTRSSSTPDRLHTTNQQDKYKKRIKTGDLKTSIGKIRSKGKYPAIYIGPRASVMRAGKKTIDGFYAQFITFGFKTSGKQKRTFKTSSGGSKTVSYAKKRTEVRPRTKVFSVMKQHSGPTKARISKKLAEKINAEWRK